MEIKARVKDNIVILDLYGRIDANSANLVEAVGQCIHDGFSDILLNFDSVEFIDYLGISAIVLTYKEVVNSEGRLKIANVPAHLKQMFSVTGLDRVIDIYATDELAENSFKEDKNIEDIQKKQLRRRFKRLDIEIKIELKSKSDKTPFCINADLLNLSAVGAYIYGCDKFKLGDDVVLRLKLPPAFGELELDAKVVWLSDKQVQNQLHPGMGIVFHNIAGPVQAKLVEFIDKNLSLSPTDQ